ncbi:MAG: peptide chain release factor N(5)-glutamine methyltransferase [Meiothermus sp.]|nr:peptide chain release factor N(5)-glutamine methyltransferase [Meiothermus sp.]
MESYLTLLRALQRQLEVHGKPPAEARWMLERASGLEASELIRNLQQPVPGGVAEVVWGMLERRLQGYPLQLLLGETEFFGLRLEVAPGVFIPRPETEGLVELALGYLPERAASRVLDVGTGSGAIALALKARRPEAFVWATDLNPKALALARRNARRLGLEVALLEAPFTGGLNNLDLLVSNPPYLPEVYREEAPAELTYEDGAALYAGPDGLGVARPLLREAEVALRRGGWLLLELAPENVGVLAEEAVARGWRAVRVERDLAGRPRYLVARWGDGP